MIDNIYILGVTRRRLNLPVVDEHLAEVLRTNDSAPTSLLIVCRFSPPKADGTRFIEVPTHAVREPPSYEKK